MKLVSATAIVLSAILIVSPSCHRGTDHCNVANAFSPFSPIIRHHGGSSRVEVSSSSSAVEEEVADPPVIKEKEKEKSLTQRIMESTSTSQQATGAGGSSTWDAFQRTELNWSRLKSSKSFDYDVTNLSTIQNENGPPQFVTSDGACGNPKCWSKLRTQQSATSSNNSKLDYDVTLCGGTLGIFIAMALQLKGHDVAVIEAGKLMGREQEWNISMKELEELIDLGVLTKEDVDEAIKTEFPGCRAGFKNREGEYILYMYLSFVCMCCVCCIDQCIHT